MLLKKEPKSCNTILEQGFAKYDMSTSRCIITRMVQLNESRILVAILPVRFCILLTPQLLEIKFRKDKETAVHVESISFLLLEHSFAPILRHFSIDRPE